MGSYLRNNEYPHSGYKLVNLILQLVSEPSQKPGKLVHMVRSHIVGTSSVADWSSSLLDIHLARNAQSESSASHDHNQNHLHLQMEYYFPLHMQQHKLGNQYKYLGQ